MRIVLIGLWYAFCAAVGWAIPDVLWPPPPRGLIVCNADGSSLVARIDSQGIPAADLAAAVQLMCKYKKGMGV